MTKCETVVLKNGIRLVMCEDKTKNKTFMEIIVKFGGLTRNFEIDGEKYEVKPGLAHLLEHALVENSIYGNMFDYLSDKYVNFNATTSTNQTSFYMHTVYDAEEHLKELINIVNKTNFDVGSLDKTKAPVLEEIKRGRDRNYEEFRLASINAVLVNNKMVNNLGQEEDILSCTPEHLKFIHDVFYKPVNQTIALCGNFDIEHFKKVIEETYDKIEFSNYNYNLLDKHEDDEITEDFVKIVKPDLDEVVKISFKINISHLSPKERVKLSFYGSYFLDYNFDDSSKAFKKIKNEKLSPYSIGRSVNTTFEDYLIISLSLYGTDVEAFKSIVFDIVKNKSYDEEMFNLMKKQTMIELINRDEHCSRMIGPYLSNVVDYKYYEVDKLSDIEEFTIEDYLSTLNSLDFSKVSVAVQVKE